MMSLWLAEPAAKLTGDRTHFHKEKFSIIAEHLAEVINCLLTASSGEERGSSARAMCKKQWHDGALDLVAIFDAKQEETAKPPAKDSEELAALKKQVADLTRLQQQNQNRPQQQPQQQPIVIVPNSQNYGRGRGGSGVNFWRDNRGRGRGSRGRGRGAW